MSGTRSFRGVEGSRVSRGWVYTPPDTLDPRAEVTVTVSIHPTGIRSCFTCIHLEYISR